MSETKVQHKRLPTTSQNSKQKIQQLSAKQPSQSKLRKVEKARPTQKETQPQTAKGAPTPLGEMVLKLSWCPNAPNGPKLSHADRQVAPQTR